MGSAEFHLARLLSHRWSAEPAVSGPESPRALKVKLTLEINSLTRRLNL